MLEVHHFESILCRRPQHFTHITAGPARLRNQVYAPVGNFRTKTLPEEVERLNEPDSPGHCVVELADMGRERPVFCSRNNVHCGRKVHTGIVHPGKVAEEVGQGIFQIFDPSLFLEIEESERYNRKEHGKYCKVIDRSRFKEYRHAVRPHHE